MKKKYLAHYEIILLNSTTILLDCFEGRCFQIKCDPPDGCQQLASNYTFSGGEVKVRPTKSS